MTAEVKNVTGVVKETVDDIKKTANEVAGRLREKNKEAKEALGLVDDFGRELGKATGELRALLGGATNNPPAAEGEKKTWLK